LVLAVACLVLCGWATAATGGDGAATAGPEFVPGEVIVQFKPGLATAARRTVVAAENAELAGNLRVPEAALVKLPPGQSVASAVSELAARPGVVAAQPNFVYHAQALPSDPLFVLLWGLNNTGQAVGSSAGAADADIDAPEAWDLTTGSSSVRVGVVDTGVEYDNPDLAGNITQLGFDFYSNDNDPRDENGHGTHVAGTIGARNNGFGVVGVNWQVDVMPIRVLGPTGSGTTAMIANGFTYAAQNGARVVNASLGGSSYDPILEAAVANAPGTLFVVAAGNGGRDRVGDDNDAFGGPVYPCNLPATNLVCVAATDPTDSLATFSNYGTTSVDLAAPGVEVTSTYVGGIYTDLSGTSMATPHVAGVAALMLARNPAATVAQLRAALLGSVDVLPTLGGRVATAGRVNAYKAVLAIAPPPPSPAAPPPAPAPPPATRPVKKKVVKVTLCYRHRTVKVTKTKAAKLRKKGAKRGACKPKKKKRK
jgi:subtilisin family serine protease